MPAAILTLAFGEIVTDIQPFKAGVAELADALDSKSCVHWTCGFDPLRR